jgi:tRNA uridine 5-carboxymethylaminomethyl modification enzyme
MTEPAMPPGTTVPAPLWWSSTTDGIWDVVIVGAGHAGLEAALAGARMGARVLVVTADIGTVASMPCNPSVGGPAKGHLVREIDALGGAMGFIADRTALQVRMLNTGKGAAVQAIRAQVDKAAYATVATEVLGSHPNVTRRAAMVTGLVTEVVRDASRGSGPRHVAVGVTTATGDRIAARAVVLTAGTFLEGRLVRGEVVEAGGRHGEGPAVGVSASLAALGIRTARHKTGTPPRVDARTIDYGLTEFQTGSDRPLWFAHDPAARGPIVDGVPHPAYPGVSRDGWRVQLPCYLVHTNLAAHDVIRTNLHRAPMYNGTIDAPGPRYCPSIEAKVVRFADKARHQVFLEPEGFGTEWVYVQGANTSLPDDVQAAMLATIPALARARILRPGYAVEYDHVPADQSWPHLENRAVAGLFLAGQVNGTSGYEEAAAQGLLAGANAALRARALCERPGTCDAPWTPWHVRRSTSYLGVLVDDLTTATHNEPYRVHTARAEHRLLLRHDNADLRLVPEAHALGLVSATRAAATEAKRERIASVLAALSNSRVTPAHATALTALGFPPVVRASTAREYLCRPGVTAAFMAALGGDASRLGIDDDVATAVEVEAKYAGYVARQAEAVARTARMDEVAIPATLDVGALPGLRSEARERLRAFRPVTVGQASRIAGVTAADVAVLLVRLKAG